MASQGTVERIDALATLSANHLRAMDPSRMHIDDARRMCIDVYRGIVQVKDEVTTRMSSLVLGDCVGIPSASDADAVIGDTLQMRFRIPRSTDGLAFREWRTAMLYLHKVLETASTFFAMSGMNPTVNITSLLANAYTNVPGSSPAERKAHVPDIAAFAMNSVHDHCRRLGLDPPALDKQEVESRVQFLIRDIRVLLHEGKPKGLSYGRLIAPDAPHPAWEERAEWKGILFTQPPRSTLFLRYPIYEFSELSFTYEWYATGPTRLLEWFKDFQRGESPDFPIMPEVRLNWWRPKAHK